MGRENRSVDAFDLYQTPALSEINRALGRAIQLSIRTHIPSTIVAYDPSTQTAQVTVDALPVVKVTDPTRIPKNILTLKGTPPNAEAVLAPIMLSQIPVSFLSASTGYIAVPLVPGDTGMLHVSDRSLESWLRQGIPTDPVFAFTHALKDSVFYPGLRPTPKPITPPPTGGTVVDGTPLVKIGPTATESITKAESLLLALTTAVTATVTVPMDGGASFKSTLLAQLALILPTTIGSTKGKVE